MSYGVTLLLATWQKIHSLQKKIIRVLTWSEPNTPSRPLFHRLGLLRLTEYNTFHNACMIFQVVHKLNYRLCELVPISRPQHTYHTRERHLITGKIRRLKCTSLSVVCRGPEIWNELEENLKLLHSVSVFKKNLKEKLLLIYTFWSFWKCYICAGIVCCCSACLVVFIFICVYGLSFLFLYVICCMVLLGPLLKAFNSFFGVSPFYTH